MSPARLKKTAIWLIVGVVLASGAFIGARHLWRRLGAAADVTEFIPADADVIIWIPRADEFTEALLQFARGVQEAKRLRELLKPETGVDLGDPDGLRRVGVDPEGGLVLFRRERMIHILFGVEDADTFIEALSAKFSNLGFPAALSTAPDVRGVVVHVIPTKDRTGSHAAFAADDGLLVLVYRSSGSDPESAVRRVLDGVGEAGAFVRTEAFREIEERLGSDGPLLYASGDVLARNRDGKPRMGFLDELGLPDALDILLRPRLSSFLSGVSYAAARARVQSCGASVRGMLRVRDGVTLLPEGFVLPETVVAPRFGQMLPRDTIAMARLGIRIEGLTDIVRRVSSLAAGVDELRRLLAGGGKSRDPLAGLLGKHAHSDLSDMHVLDDVADHLTGHVALGLLGLGRDAGLGDVFEPERLVDWLAAVQLVLCIQLKEPRAFFDKWWAKRTLLGKLGFRVERLVHPSWQILRARRNCGDGGSRDEADDENGKPCEHYGLVLAGDVLLLATGEGTVERVVDAMSGAASSLQGLTREPVALAVLEDGHMLAGAYFSFDGLLKAVRNRNLPGGATRYLAQMYELAITLNANGGDTRAEVLLTR